MVYNLDVSNYSRNGEIYSQTPLASKILPLIHHSQINNVMSCFVLDNDLVLHTMFCFNFIVPNRQGTF